MTAQFIIISANLIKQSQWPHFLVIKLNQCTVFQGFLTMLQTQGYDGGMSTSKTVLEELEQIRITFVTKFSSGKAYLPNRLNN